MNRETLTSDLQDPEVVAGCLIVLYASQTPEEQGSRTTHAVNGVGFNMLDAAFGCSLAEQVIGKGSLTVKQVSAARKILRKYTTQIASRVDESPRHPLGVRTITNQQVDSDLTEIPL